MIPYEDVTLRDARMYWEGAQAFVWLPESGTVLPYHMNLPYSEYDEDRDEYGGEDDAFEDVDVVLVPTCTHMPDAPVYPDRERVVLGRTLFRSADYIMHRLPAEYVALDDHTLCRVNIEPTGNRAFKGVLNSDVDWMSLLEGELDHTGTFANRHMDTRCLFINNAAPVDSLRFSKLYLGMAKVLTLGHPLSIRRNISADEASIRSKAAVREFFQTDKTVIVPDFPVALVKHRSRNEVAYVLHRGKIIGEARFTDEGVVFHGTLNRGEDSSIAAARKAGQQSLAMRLFADAVTWSQ